MNKKITLCAIFVSSLMFPYTNKKILNFGEDTIRFNGTEEKIKNLIDDPEFQKVTLIHCYSDHNRSTCNYQGTVGSPRCYSFDDPVAAIIGIQKKENGTLWWCEEQKMFIVQTGRYNYPFCLTCGHHMQLIAATD